MNIQKVSSHIVIAVSLLSLSFGSMATEVTSDQYQVQSSKAHEVLIINNGLAALEKRLEMIESAKKTINVEYFIYHTDTSAKLFTQALVKKAKEGVHVRMLLDTFMVIGDLTPFHAFELEKAGIEIKYFNKAGILNFKSNQYRNHRKLLSIDGKEALTGGRNIGDEYFDLSHEYNFLDRDIYLKGEIVKSIEITFDQFFNADVSARRERPKKPDRRSYSDFAIHGQMPTNPTSNYKRDLKKWDEKVKAAEEFVSIAVSDKKQIRESGRINLDSEKGGVCTKLSFMSEFPLIGRENRLHNRVIKYGILDRIRNAKKSILMESPYFIINKELADALDVALTQKNKVDVRLLTNSLNSTDATYVYAIFDSTIQEWIDKGFEPYIFKADRSEDYKIIESKSSEARFGIHSKTFVFDDKDFMIGTYNVDPRSANYNAEMIIACDGNKDLAQIVSDGIESRIQGSFHLSSAEDVKKLEFYNTSFKKRLAYYLQKIPSNLFSFLF